MRTVITISITYCLNRIAQNTLSGMPGVLMSSLKLAGPGTVLLIPNASG